MAHLLDVDADFDDLQQAAKLLDSKLIEGLVLVEDFHCFRRMMLHAVKIHAEREKEVYGRCRGSSSSTTSSSSSSFPSTYALFDSQEQRAEAGGCSHGS